MPRMLEEWGYDGLSEELISLTHCPYCLSLYTTILVLIMPKWAKRGLMVWMGCYAIIYLIKEKLNDPTQTEITH